MTCPWPRGYSRTSKVLGLVLGSVGLGLPRHLVLGRGDLEFSRACISKRATDAVKTLQ